ncbi:asparagine synthase-related protein [Nocardia vulneris]|uniref:Asparagine synthetase domain-containing protein n=1 Tax=Nocardia vulneris TaxID=1141657 RepID=A0ABR4Z5G8_9NOCA|nr:asparagine synthase-related protein [Nocardia vulneris]KIA60562.1 hypothetical protein FG87_36215 [Nocardia vulneris]
MTASDFAEQTGESLQYVADLQDIAATNPGLRQLADPAKAAELIAEETCSRLDAIFRAQPGEPVVLLSGGVDSILVAAAAVSIGARPRAITVIAEGGTDRTNATAAATALGLRHDVVELDQHATVSLAQDAVRRLGLPELWEVSYAIPLLSMLPTLNRIDTVGPILTGSGADAIIAGGRELHHPVNSAEAAVELDQIVRAESANNFVYQRLVPDFYPRVLGRYADQLVHVFQTVRFWTVAETLGPSALFGDHDGEPVDKLCLRMACETLLPTGAGALAWAKKSAIQRSAGIMGSLSDAARRYAASLPGARTYTDPMTEPFEAVATRLFLAILSDTDNPGQELSAWTS